MGPPNTTFNDHQITFHLDGEVQAAETATYRVQSSPTAIFHLGFDLTFANLPQPDPTPTPEVALPAIYAGEIVVSGGLVPDGATLVARIGSYESAPGVVVGQTYEMLVVNPGDIALVGQPVEFVLNGETAITMGMYVSGANNDSFLLVFHALPTPTPEPTPSQHRSLRPSRRRWQHRSLRLSRHRRQRPSRRRRQHRSRRPEPDARADT